MYSVHHLSYYFFFRTIVAPMLDAGDDSKYSNFLIDKDDMHMVQINNVHNVFYFDL